MGRRIWISLAALGVLAAALAPAGAQDTIKIGFFAPLTGSVSADGTSARQSVELARAAVAFL